MIEKREIFSQFLKRVRKESSLKKRLDVFEEESQPNQSIYIKLNRKKREDDPEAAAAAAAPAGDAGGETTTAAAEGGESKAPEGGEGGEGAKPAAEGEATTEHKAKGKGRVSTLQF